MNLNGLSLENIFFPAEASFRKVVIIMLCDKQSPVMNISIEHNWSLVYRINLLILMVDLSFE